MAILIEATGALVLTGLFVLGLWVVFTIATQRY
jgi:hypothetical protein